MAGLHTTDNHSHEDAHVPISDGHASANGGAPQGPSPPPAAGLPLGGRASTDASGRALRLREEDAEATTPALTEPAAVVADGGSPAEGGSPTGTGLALAADPAPGECLSEARYHLLHRTAVSFVSHHATPAMEVTSLWLMQDSTNVLKWKVSMCPEILWDELCTI